MGGAIKEALTTGDPAHVIMREAMGSLLFKTCSRSHPVGVVIRPCVGMVVKAAATLCFETFGLDYGVKFMTWLNCIGNYRERPILT